MTTVSFIVPCFNEEESIEPFCREFVECFSGSAYEWRILFVDDGSSDNTWMELVRLAGADSRVQAIRFSRNFGKEAAIWAGLNNADADYIGIIDADLQQPPADALAMCRILDMEPSIDCVAAFQESRYEKGMLGRIKKAFYGVFAKVTGLDAVHDASDFRVFRRNVAVAVLSLPEHFRFSKGIFAWVGFETRPYPYAPRDRKAGESKWSFFGLIKYAIEGMLAFSVTPLRIATGLGLFAALCSVVYFLAVFTRALVVGIEVPGYATLMSVVLLLGGVQLVCIGIVGEYLARTYIQGKNRPVYLERARAGFSVASEEAE